MQAALCGRTSLSLGRGLKGGRHCVRISAARSLVECFGDIRGTMITCRSDGGTELCTFRALDPRQSLNKNELDSGIDADVMLEMAH